MPNEIQFFDEEALERLNQGFLEFSASFQKAVRLEQGWSQVTPTEDGHYWMLERKRNLNLVRLLIDAEVILYEGTDRADDIPLEGAWWLKIEEPLPPEQTS